MHSLLKDNMLNHAAIISGFSLSLAFAENEETFIHALKQGQRVVPQPWFDSDIAAQKFNHGENKSAAKLNTRSKGALAHCCAQIEATLAKAQLDRKALSGENVRVYLTGLGQRVDIFDYFEFYDHNDIEDVSVTKSVANLHAAKISQDHLAHQIATQFKLKYTPPNLNCTSNSSLAAIHLAAKAIECGAVDIAIVINCSIIATQDIQFLTEYSMLDSTVVQPFGEISKSVLFAEGYSAILLESRQHRLDRGLTEGVRLQATYAQTSANRSNDAAQLSSNIIKVMNKSLEQAQITTDQLCAIIPHGNGSEVTDKAEAQAIMSLLPEQTVPVLAYKGQIGYTATGSGIADLIIAHYTLQQNELISPVSNGAIRENFARYVLCDQGVVPHQKNHLLKMGLGVDGSIIAAVLSKDNHVISQGGQ